MTNDGLSYVDDAGQVCLIRFTECRRNWVDFVNRSAEFPETNLTEAETKCVAWRDIIGRPGAPSYIEFFASPRIRFEFHLGGTRLNRFLRNSRAKEQRHFREIASAIVAYGWTTFDMS